MKVKAVANTGRVRGGAVMGALVPEEKHLELSLLLDK